ncbi:TetR/AcrR family transcriptional regulator [Metaclostridioides mangenotii]|uniref:AcrR family transcriptional regulator n=1 Tax=Metaclostridioides mangenotii TaxID=1540 RepID=A0ABS4EBX0_9FIRM|nr:TetR/AcrR family transcriptional regulator [Clostridioides mangenotii]MBP1855431.1 AcrR family transcriptional regulator [Clostridioides mangenotii]
MTKKLTAEEVKTLILDTAADLFIEKGYVDTSISDIVSRLDGLTKGAVYHHFNSKEEIINSLVRGFIPKDDILDKIELNEELSGLEKIQETLFEGMFNRASHEETAKYYGLLNETTFYSIYIRMVNELTIERLIRFITEGNEDGSTNVEKPKQMSEVILLLVSTWFINVLYVTTPENFFDKIDTASTILRMSKVDVLNEEFTERMINSIKNLNLTTEEEDMI